MFSYVVFRDKSSPVVGFSVEHPESVNKLAVCWTFPLATFICRLIDSIIKLDGAAVGLACWSESCRLFWTKKLKLRNLWDGKSMRDVW